MRQVQNAVLGSSTKAGLGMSRCWRRERDVGFHSIELEGGMLSLELLWRELEELHLLCDTLEELHLPGNAEIVECRRGK